MTKYAILATNVASSLYEYFDAPPDNQQLLYVHKVESENIAVGKADCLPFVLLTGGQGGRPRKPRRGRRRPPSSPALGRKCRRKRPRPATVLMLRSTVRARRATTGRRCSTRANLGTVVACTSIRALPPCNTTTNAAAVKVSGRFRRINQFPSSHGADSQRVCSPCEPSAGFPKLGKPETLKRITSV